MKLIEKSKAAFTLVELAIVIVIIGLLVGGVLQGQELIAQAKIRAQIKQLQAYDAAGITFKSKYGHIAGDLPVALATSIGLDQPNTTYAGNGRLEDYLGNVPPVHANHEPWRSLWHLHKKGLIKAQMTNTPISDFSIGVYFPSADIGKGGVCIVSMRDGLYYFLGPSERNVGYQTPFTISSANPFLTPTEAFSIDQKLDDGVPSQGIVRAVIVTDTSSTNFSNDTEIDNCLGATNASYNFANDTNRCRLVVKSSLN
jgi:prepilin-type N-terminal cleavage/methylation domain-containing protein